MLYFCFICFIWKTYNIPLGWSRSNCANKRRIFHAEQKLCQTIYCPFCSIDLLPSFSQLQCSCLFRRRVSRILHRTRRIICFSFFRNSIPKCDRKCSSLILHFEIDAEQAFRWRNRFFLNCLGQLVLNTGVPRNYESRIFFFFIITITLEEFYKYISKYKI